MKKSLTSGSTYAIAFVVTAIAMTGSTLPLHVGTAQGSERYFPEHGALWLLLMRMARICCRETWSIPYYVLRILGGSGISFRLRVVIIYSDIEERATASASASSQTWRAL